MVTLSDARIDELIAEDVPYIDLTSHILGIDAQAGAMEYFAREACVLAGGEVASRIATKLGCAVTNILPDGTSLEAGQSFMTIAGTARPAPSGLEGLSQRLRPSFRRGHQDPHDGRRRACHQPVLRDSYHAQEHAGREGPPR